MALRPGPNPPLFPPEEMPLVAPSPGPRGGMFYVAPEGYALSPGTGPEGQTCGTCTHRYTMLSGHSKCALMGKVWDRTARTNILVKADACRDWSRRRHQPRRPT